MIHGAILLAVAKRFRILSSVSPRYFEKISGLDNDKPEHGVIAWQEKKVTYPLIEMTFNIDSEARACTNAVFPHPSHIWIMRNKMTWWDRVFVVPEGP